MILQFSDYSLDLAGHTLTDRTGAEIALTPGEFRLLKEFVQRPEQVLSGDDLLNAAVGHDAEVDDRSIDMLVVRLRRKIEPDPNRPGLIVTIPGSGYKFTAKVTQSAPVEKPDQSGFVNVQDHCPAMLERRQLTILQCSLSGPAFSTAKRNLEDLHALLTAFHQRCAQIIAEAGGTVAQRLSDGVLACFGYPQDDEHQAERAVRAGLSLIGAADRIRTGKSGGLHTRIGIASGLVVIGGLAGLPDESAILGEVVTYIAQLAAHADPDTVLITTATQRLIGRLFRCRGHAPLVLDETEPLPTWIVESPASSDSRFDSVRAAQLTPLIGREAELVLLMKRWEMAQEGEGQTVLLSGEAGIGKSRILKELSDRLGQDRVERIRLQCSPHAADSAYHPIIDNLMRALQFGRNDTPDAKLDRIEGLVAGQHGLPRNDARFIASILSIPCEHRYGRLAMLPQKAKDETLRVLVDIVEASARRHPAVSFVEDVHWADPTTLEALTLLIDRLAHIPLLLILTHRPEFQSRWANFGNVTTMTLPKLTRVQSTSLIMGISRGEALPPDLVESILARTDGVPLFVEEVTKSVLEAAALGAATAAGWQTGAVSTAGVPLTLRDSLMARLDQHAPMKEIAQLGAAIGREFDHELIAALAPHGSAERDRALHRLVTSGLASCKGTPPNAIYRFKHVLVQDAAYDSLLWGQRQTLHLRIAGILEQRQPGLRETEPELLAHHYTEAAHLGEAIPLWHRAGQLALRRMTLTEAVRHLNRGLDLIAMVAPSAERDGWELDLRTALSTAWMRLKGWQAEEVWASAFPALALARSLGRADALLPILTATFLQVLSVGHDAEALGWARQSLEAAEMYQDRNLLIQGHFAMVTACFWTGDLIACRHHAQQLLSIYDPHRDMHLADVVSHDPKSTALHYLAKATWILGYPDEAVRINAAKEAHARQRGAPFDLAYTISTGAQVFNYIHQPDQALARAKEGERLGREHGLSVFANVIAPLHIGMTLIRLNQVTEGTRLLSTSLEAWDAGGGRNGMTYCKTVLAEGLAQLGRLDDAMRVLDAAIAQAERPGWEERCYLAEMLRIKGEVLAQEGDFEGAETAYIASLDQARRQQARSWEVRTAMSYARLMRDQRRTWAAYHLLAPVLAWFSEGFGTKDLQDAKALLDKIAEPTADVPF
ncbi:MAG: winged helix-turn-helix domain-containing protein [Rhodopila sp.]